MYVVRSGRRTGVRRSLLAQLNRKAAELCFIRFKDVSCPRCPGVPKSVGHDKIEDGKYDTDDKCAEEKVPEENDFVVFHCPQVLAPIIYFKEAGSITNTNGHLLSDQPR